MKYDLAIIGAGPAGVFASLKLLEINPDARTVLIDLGRPPAKRRRQLEGWLGCFPTGDGKIYPSDVHKVERVTGQKDLSHIYTWFKDILKASGPTKIIKSKAPSAKTTKHIKKEGFEIELLDYMQWIPDHIHALSRDVAKTIIDSRKFDLNFDNEVFSIIKQKGGSFCISSEKGEIQAETILLCVGRSGWRWANGLFKKFDILTHDDYVHIGFMAETQGAHLKDFNKSHCILTKDDVTFGPLSWGGSVIQEDHEDMTLAAFRSNEGRWKTEKAFFKALLKVPFTGKGVYQADRLSKLSFLLSGDRVGREKIKTITKNNNQLLVIKEYALLKELVGKMTPIFPEVENKGFFHHPCINTVNCSLNLDHSLQTEVEGLYVAGETAGIEGLGAAAMSGALVVESLYG